MSNANVDTQSAAVAQMAAEWPLIDALMGGTRAMRAAGRVLLPQWPAEDGGAYKCRLAQATLFPAYSRTISVMSGKPFARQLTLSEKTPDQVRAWCDDVDRQGTNLHVFAANLFHEAIGWGIAGILVDAPKAKGLPANATRADQAKAGMRPYCVAIRHDQVLGWRAADRGRGVELTQLRLKEVTTEPDGEWGESEVERVRVLEIGKFRLFRKQATATGGQWVLEEEGATGFDFIPYVPIYGKRLGLMVGVPPLIDLAYQNVEHWQSKSDQQNILHVARVPILVEIGGEEGKDIVVGGVAHKMPTGGDLKWVEHSGQAIEAGRQSLIDLEARMIATGAELLVAKPGARTATESANDAEANKSDLQRIVEGLEDSLDVALSMMARIGGQQDTAKVSLFKDFSATSLSDASAQLILSMQQGGVIRKETAVREWQRRGVLSADIDPVAEPAMAADEVVPADDLTE